MAAKVEKFEDLEVWQNAIALSIDVYRKFQNCKDYSLKDQICRASVSVPSNIAEGFERQYNKECMGVQQNSYLLPYSLSRKETQDTGVHYSLILNLNLIKE